jgi:hypothetical protein
MTVETGIENLVVPDIELAGLKIWIHSRKYPEHQDFWDGNWLNTTFLCKAQGVSVLVSGDILHLSEIADWLVALEKLNETLLGEANLDTLERYVNVKMKPETYQRASIEVDISPERIFQRHYFEFWLDQSCLENLIEGFHKILKKFPIRRKAS